MAQERDAYSGPFAALIDRGEERGCVDLAEVDELAQSLELEDEDLSALYEQLHARHIELRDDCTRAVAAFDDEVAEAGGEPRGLARSCRGQDPGRAARVASAPT